MTTLKLSIHFQTLASALKTKITKDNSNETINQNRKKNQA